MKETQKKTAYRCPCTVCAAARSLTKVSFRTKSERREAFRAAIAERTKS